MLISVLWSSSWPTGLCPLGVFCVPILFTPFAFWARSGCFLRWAWCVRHCGRFECAFVVDLFWGRGVLSFVIFSDFWARPFFLCGVGWLRFSFFSCVSLAVAALVFVVVSLFFCVVLIFFFSVVFCFRRSACRDVFVLFYFVLRVLLLPPLIRPVFDVFGSGVSFTSLRCFRVVVGFFCVCLRWCVFSIVSLWSWFSRVVFLLGVSLSCPALWRSGSVYWSLLSLL